MKKSIKFKVIVVVLVILLLAGATGAGIYFLGFNGSDGDSKGSSSSAKPLEGNSDKETADGETKIEDKTENNIVMENEITVRDIGKIVKESETIMIES